MQTHDISSSSTNRSSAESHRGNGTSLPAAQLYKPGTYQDAAHRFSNDENMAVKNSGNPDYFFANADADRATKVLKETGVGPGNMKQYGADIGYYQDCGGYANLLLQKIHGFNQETQENFKTTLNSTSRDKVVPPNFLKLFDQELSGPAQPGIGEVYFAVHDPQEFIQPSKKYYNFHWATVIAKDGSDVVTAEASPNDSKEWFQMYNQVTENQTFRQHYVFTLEKLKNSVKVFALAYHQRQKPEKVVYDIVDSDEEK